MSKVWGERFAVVPDSILEADVSVTAKALWTVLARYADPQGHCYPNVPTLAGKLRVSEQTVRRAKAELVGAGLLVVKPRFGEDGGQRSDDLFLRRGGSKNDTGPPSKNGRAELNQYELETTSREPLKNGHYQSPAFECPVCPRGDKPDPGCTICGGTGTFRLEAADR